MPGGMFHGNFRMSHPLSTTQDLNLEPPRYKLGALPIELAVVAENGGFEPPAPMKERIFSKDVD